MRNARSSSFEQLIRAGLAPRRARRILREFKEHRADLMDEQRQLGTADAQANEIVNDRLGSEQQLIAGLLRRPELRSWSRRRPGFAYGLAPLLYLALAFCLSLLVFIVLVEWHKSRGDAVIRASLLIQGISRFGSAYLLWGLPLLTGLLLTLIAAYRRESSNWPWIGILVTSFVGALTTFTFDLTPMRGAPSMGAGIGIGTDHLGPVLVRMITTSGFALAPYLWVRRAQRREQIQ